MTLIVETHLRVLREIVESLATHGLYQIMALAHNVTACNYPLGLASGILSGVDCSVLLARSGQAGIELHNSPQVRTANAKSYVRSA